MISRRPPIIYVVNEAAFFVRHRLGHVADAVAAGYDVHVAVPQGPGYDTIAADGARMHTLPLIRGSSAPWNEAASFAMLVRLYRQVRPIMVHHITVKPVLYGTVAARVTRVPAVVNTIPGLGWLFTGQGTRGKLLRRAATFVYRAALAHPRMRVIVQNPDDRDFLLQQRIVKAAVIAVIDGAGIDLEEFTPAPLPQGVPIVVLPARMLRDKGVEEFVAAARRLRGKVSARFVLVGDVDPQNPAGLDREVLGTWQSDGDVEWWGHRTDMPSVLAQSAVVVLPSYREGMPRVLMEAAASGRPVVTTDVPGCRQAVIPQETGFIVPPRNAEQLASAIQRLLEDGDLRQSMGAAARRMAVRRWDLHLIIAATFAVYDELLGAERPLHPIAT